MYPKSRYIHFDCSPPRICWCKSKKWYKRRNKWMFKNYRDDGLPLKVNDKVICIKKENSVFERNSKNKIYKVINNYVENGIEYVKLKDKDGIIYEWSNIDKFKKIRCN